MTKKQYRKRSYLAFFLSIVYIGLTINALLTQSGWMRLISAALFGVLVLMQLRIAFSMRRNCRNLDLK